MYNLYIDSMLIEGLSGLGLKLGYDGTAAGDPTHQGELAVEIEVPSSPNVDQVMSWARELHTEALFHEQSRWGRLLYNCEPIFEGELRIAEVVEREGCTIYRLRITRPAPEWLTLAQGLSIADLDFDYQERLNLETIAQSWVEDAEVRFFPVHRDSYEQEWSAASNATIRRINTIDDYHPFLNIRKIIARLAAKAGYKVVSDLFASDEFASLYMSGTYGSSRGDVAKEKMDFMVRRGSDGSATVDVNGRVYLTGGVVGSSSVGYMVSAATLGSDGECYSYGGCFREVDGVPTFTPLGSVSVGFVYHFCYMSDYRIETRTALRGLDTFYLGYGEAVSVDLVNNFADKRHDLRASYQYRLVVFIHTSGRKYRICDGNGGVVATVDGRTGLFVAPATIIGEYSLQWSSDGVTYGAYTGDWALYNGYVDEQGEMEIDLTIRSAPQKASPKSPVRFANIYLGGANPEMNFTLKAASSIKPYFAGYPGYGSTINYCDVAPKGVRVVELISSLAQMFNLRFYSDSMRKRLYVDNYATLPAAHGVYDWSAKQLPELGMTLQSNALGRRAMQRRGYQLHDGYTLRLEELDEDEVYGRYDWTLDSSAASEGRHTELNGLFSPSMCDEEGVLIVGDRDDLELVDSYDFSPRVAYQVEEGSAGVPPRLAFHSSEDSVSLCFEDREGVDGLFRRYYLDEWDKIAEGQIVTTYLKLEPYEVVELLSPRESVASVWSLFRLCREGVYFTARMLSLEGYDPEEGVARCKFLIIV